MKRVLPFGAAVLVAGGLGFLPVIGCLASSGPAEPTSDQEGQDGREADVPLAPEAARASAGSGRCGTDGYRCCPQACCHDGSACVYKHLRRICMMHPPRGSRIVRSICDLD